MNERCEHQHNNNSFFMIQAKNVFLFLKPKFVYEKTKKRELII